MAGLELLQTPGWLAAADALAKATLLLAGAAIVTRLLRTRSAAARHLVWTAALLAALALPAASLVMPRWQVPVITIEQRAAASSEASLERAAALQARLKSGAAETPAAKPVGSAPAPAGAAAFWRTISWTSVALAVWIAGVLAILGRLAAGAVAITRLARRSRPADDAAWGPLGRALAEEMGVRRVSFRRGEAGSMPMTCGILRPSVLLPAEADEWPEARLRVVLLHELAHVKRADCLTHMLAQAACAFHWMNPLAWIAARHIRTERERACDDLVLAFGTPETQYADQLLEIARAMRAVRFSPTLASASLAMAHRSQLEGRLMAILDPSIPRTGISRARAIAAATIGFAALLPLASLQPYVSAQTLASAPAPLAHVVEPAVVPQPRPRPQPKPKPAVSTESVIEAVVTPMANAIAGSVANAITEGTINAIADATAQAVNKEVKPEVIRNAGRQVDPKVIASLTEALKDTDKDVRETAMHALISLRATNIFEPLVAALKDASSDIREQAAFGLGQMRDKRALPALAAALKDSSAGVREQAAFALGQLRDDSVAEALAGALRDENASVREQAAFALGQLRSKAAVDGLLIALKDASPSVREQAAFALGQIGDPRALDALTTTLKDANASVRQQAAFAIGQLAR